MKISFVVLFIFSAFYCLCQNTSSFNAHNFEKAPYFFSIDAKYHISSRLIKSNSIRVKNNLSINKNLILKKDKVKKERVIPLALGVLAGSALFILPNGLQNRRNGRRFTQGMFSAGFIGGLSGLFSSGLINIIARQ